MTDSKLLLFHKYILNAAVTSGNVFLFGSLAYVVYTVWVQIPETNLSMVYF